MKPAATPTPEPGYLLGALLITGLVLPQLAVLSGFIAPYSHAGYFCIGVYILYVGLLFLSSYYWSDKTFVLRGFMWVCEHGNYPRGRKAAFIYFAFCALLGCMTILAGLGMIQTRY